jgi:DNA-binding response OmpR family regulator
MSLLRQSACERNMLESILLVGCLEEDQRGLRDILADWRVPVESVRTMKETLRHLLGGPVPLILCERDLPDGNWKLLFQKTETLPHPPRFIVSSRHADDRLWVEVLNWGGQDVLQTPFVAREVRHAVRCAWDAWRTWAPATMRPTAGLVANAAAAGRNGAADTWPLAPEGWPEAVGRLIGRKPVN